MGLKSSNLLVGKVLPKKVEEPPSRKMSVGEKLALQINKAKGIEQKKIEPVSPPLEVVRPIKVEPVKPIPSKVKEEPVIPLLMKDQIIKSSKYLQDLTNEEK